MVDINRRKFIKSSGGLVAGTILGITSSASADWGGLPPTLSPGLSWPGPLPQYKVLEIFLYGGVSPWETFYHRPSLADPWYGQLADINALNWDCNNAPSPNSQTQQFTSDNSIHLGPLARPLWPAFIRDRMRMVVLKHGLEPHEAAVPYSITGHVLGRPNFSSLGAAISHRYKTASSNTPLSYVFMPDNLGVGSDNFQAVDATGTHGGDHRPLKLIMGLSGGDLVTRLARTGITTSRDNLFNHYRASYRDQFRWKMGTPAEEIIRSRGFAAYDASANTLINATNLQSILSTTPLAVRTAQECPISGVVNKADRTTASIDSAATLLTTPVASGGARHVCVVDSGLNHYGGATYDTHSTNIQGTAINLWNVLSALANVIRDPATPDANKINLDDTLIVLKTEFGRTPATSGSGRDHWPSGYVNILIGGPVVSESPKNVVGEMNPAGVAVDSNHYTPTDLQAALLLAAGIFPFEPENFGIGDMGSRVRRASEEETTIALWNHILLGLTA